MTRSATQTSAPADCGKRMRSPRPSVTVLPMRTAPALLIAALLAGSLSGCFQSSPVVLPEPEPSVAPIFASEEEALAAAEEAYGRYLAVLDEIFADGGKEPERLLDVATEAALDSVMPSFLSYESKGKRSIGYTAFDTASIQSMDTTGQAEGDVVIMCACEDYSALDVVDSDGNSTVAVERVTRWPVTVSFDHVRATADTLIVSLVEPWTGADFCLGA